MRGIRVALRPAGALLAAAASSLTVVFCSEGLLYLLRSLWPIPPALPLALPLDELAGRAGIAFPVFAGVWLVAGFVLYELVPGLSQSAAITSSSLTIYCSTALSLIIARQVPVSAGLIDTLKTAAVYLAAGFTAAGLRLARDRRHWSRRRAVIGRVQRARPGIRT
jgi:hypothetical protein